jgi:lysophospholipase L1-like esterase
VRDKSRHALLCSIVVASFLAGAGCQSTSNVRQAGRSEEQRQALIKPGNIGDGAPADRLRGRFDFHNEQIIRQDAGVATVFFGDSITELWQLDAYFVSNAGVNLNRGIGGDITPHMARRFDADVIQLLPRNVVILAGTNDVARMLNAGNSDEEIIAAVMSNMETMMQSARAAGINVLVCSILPTNEDTKPHEGKARILPRINDQLRASCVAHDCVYVDYASDMVDQRGDLRKDLAGDGLHPHYAGYEIMARVLKDTAQANRLRL